MALILADRVQETSTTTGTGTLTLAGSSSGYQTFSAGIGNGNTCYYTIQSDTGAWEVGIGTVGAKTLARTTLISSSTGSAVSFSGTLTIFVTYPAEKAVYSDNTTIVAPNGALLPVANGGTGASTSANALTNLGAYPASNPNGYGIGTVTSVTGTAPVVSSGGTTPAISMAAATTSINGYLTSTDWTTFNGKQAALVSNTNIKTVNNTSLLGSGDVSVGVTSVAASVPSFLSITGSPVTSTGTLSISYSGIALPIANGGTGSTTATGSGAVVLATSPTVTGLTFTSAATAAPAFSVYLSANQTISANVWTKVAFDTKLFDTNTNFSLINNRFTPTVSGYYQINACVFLSGSGLNGYSAIYKNGTLVFYGTSSPSASGSSNPLLNCASLVQMNGTTDYLEIYAYSGGTLLGGQNSITFFNGFLARSL